MFYEGRGMLPLQ